MGCPGLEWRRRDDRSRTPVVLEPVTFEHHREALGIGEARPRISLRDSCGQHADPGLGAAGLRDPGDRRRWAAASSSGRIDGAGLGAGAVAVCTRCRPGPGDWSACGSGAPTATHPTDWSEPSTVETGLLEPSDWSAQLISPGLDRGHRGGPTADAAPSGTSTPRDEIDSARLYVTAHGARSRRRSTATGSARTCWRRAGAATDTGCATTPMTSPTCSGRAKRDRRDPVRRLVPRATSASTAGCRNIYGERLALLAQLEIRYVDGSVDTVVTDDELAGRRAARSARSGIYDGETLRRAAGTHRLERGRIRRRRVVHGRSAPPPSRHSWSRRSGPPVRRIEEVRPVDMFTSPSGRTIVDFGQNLVGRLRIRVDGTGRAPRSRCGTPRCSSTANWAPGRCGSAEATDRYTLRGGGVETWEPRFTFHGFRYAEIDGWPGDVGTRRRPGGRGALRHAADRLVLLLRRPAEPPARERRVEHARQLPRPADRLPAARRAARLDRRHPGVRADRSVPLRQRRLAGLLAARTSPPSRPNSAPCPVSCPTSSSQFPMRRRRPGVTPRSSCRGCSTSGPATLELLRRQYPSMRAWVDQVDRAGRAEPAVGHRLPVRRLARPGRAAGPARQPPAPIARWSRPRTSPGRPSIARRGGRTCSAPTADRDRYAELAARASAAAFAREYVTPSGRLVSDAPTAFALALQLRPARAGPAAPAGRRLVELVQAGGYRIATGFVGTPIICDALCDVGAYDTAYHLLTQRECPSWLYPVTMGATTIWERWDSMLPDGSVNPGRDDLVQSLRARRGRRLDAPDRRRSGAGRARLPAASLVAPRPGGGLTHATAAHETPYGRAEVSWTADGDRLRGRGAGTAGNDGARSGFPSRNRRCTRSDPGRHAFGCRFRPVEDDPPIPSWNPLRGPGVLMH